ncbi:MAG: amino acid ABC transporter permease [Desulfotalea sp.]|nr:MAG: amino acid ABC transporter permease [Desulfotalea sp.]
MMDFQFEIVTRSIPALWAGIVVTVKIGFLSFCAASLIGFCVGVLRSKSRWLSLLFAPYVEIFRGTPLLIQLFFIYYGLPTINITLSSFQAAIIGLGLNGGAYISEVVRGALQSINSGQKEAAYALGLNWCQTLTHVIMPQALAVSIPPLMNIFSSLLKETSLVSVLAITELTRVGQLIYTRSFRAFEIYLVIGFLYFIMTFTVAKISYYLERRYAIPDRL